MEPTSTLSRDGVAVAVEATLFDYVNYRIVVPDGLDAGGEYVLQYADVAVATLDLAPSFAPWGAHHPLSSRQSAGGGMAPVVA